MNNNNRGNNTSNNNNNRRRGRGSNNAGRPQGGQPLNRVDSRARGNAPQLLEKYRKLAQDAHLNGDRVTAEYYLQFADHYFRVLADSRVRQDEQRARRDERWQEGDAPPREENDDSGEYGESDFPAFDQPPAYASRRERGEQPERQERPERPEPSERQERPERPRREERQPQAAQDDYPVERDDSEVAEANVPQAAYEPAENPFVREARPSTRGLRPRRDDRRPARVNDDSNDGGESAGFDASILPPPIALSPVNDAADEAPAEARRRAPRRAKPAGDALAAVNQD